MSRPSSQYQLSPNQQDLLMAALNSNHNDAQRTSQSLHQVGIPSKGSSTDLHGSSLQQLPASDQLDFDADDSPYIDFEGEFDDAYEFDINGQQMIGDIPQSGEGATELSASPEQEHDLHDKRKSAEGKEDEDQGDAKRREGDDKVAKKPGRKPLTSEPTSKRKAQNRAAQRAFRDRKEKHLKDLETKVQDLEKESDVTNHENGLLKAQVERLQVELKEYRKRLSWASNTGTAAMPSFGANRVNPPSQGKSTSNGNDFLFEFPKFGDLPVAAFNSNGNIARVGDIGTPSRAASLPNPSVPKTHSPSAGITPQGASPSQPSTGNSPQVRQTGSPANMPIVQNGNSLDMFGGLFSPSTLAASRNYEYFARNSRDNNHNARANAGTTGASNAQPPLLYSNSSASNTDSPSGSSDSQRAASSIGTSPEPSLSSPPGLKNNDPGLNTISEENQYSQGQSFNSGDDFSWLVQQNGGNFDPVLFGDYREPQDAVINQDFGSFFNEAFPLPDLGSPLHNFNEIGSPGTVPPKIDLMKQVDAVQNGEDAAVIPEGDRSKMMTCNKIWDRLQSMEKFRNGEIDVDNLCSELRAKARCSETGAVVDQKDLDNIIGNVR